MELPLHLAAQLPPVGSSRETSQCDFKATVRLEAKPPPFFEMAKDVAAFANASGGVILVGARETANKLARYEPLPEERADAIAREYSLQVSQRCSPVPLIDPRRIQLDGGFIVAVSVWPFPAQPVGVKLAADKEVDGHKGECWVFPVRAGLDTIFIRPEQLPMLMLPQERKTALLLDGIPNEGKRDLIVTMRHGLMSHGAQKTSIEKLDLLEVRPLQNVAVFRGAAGSKLGVRPLIHIPLDGIVSVWSTAQGAWKVSLRGFVGMEIDGPVYCPVD